MNGDVSLIDRVPFEIRGFKLFTRGLEFRILVRGSLSGREAGLRSCCIGNLYRRAAERTVKQGLLKHSR